MSEDETIAELERGYVCPPDAGRAWRALCESGVDMSLLEHALSLTPEQRLNEHQQTLDFLMSIHGAGLNDGSE
jgi:hypothetical protein